MKRIWKRICAVGGAALGGVLVGNLDTHDDPTHGRPAVVYIAPTPYPTTNFCFPLDPERSERPHGGEPDIFRGATTSTTSEPLVAAVVVVHQTVLNSASNAIIEEIKLARQPHTRIPTADYGT